MSQLRKKTPSYRGYSEDSKRKEECLSVIIKAS